MKKILLGLVLICLTGILGTCLIWFFYQDGRIRIDQERTGVILLRGGYRAWWIRYSEGVVMSDPPRVLWCFPRFEHCDVRPFLLMHKKNMEEEKK